MILPTHVQVDEVWCYERERERERESQGSMLSTQVSMLSTHSVHMHMLTCASWRIYGGGGGELPPAEECRYGQWWTKRTSWSSSTHEHRPCDTHEQQLVAPPTNTSHVTPTNSHDTQWHSVSRSSTSVRDIYIPVLIMPNIVFWTTFCIMFVLIILFVIST